MNKAEKEQMIQAAAQLAFDVGVEAEIDPVAVYLQSIGHEYGRNWGFCFCVSVDIGHLEARADGYANMWDRAGRRMAAAADVPKDR